jgi:hypothetical protein
MHPLLLAELARSKSDENARRQPVAAERTAEPSRHSGHRIRFGRATHRLPIRGSRAAGTT